MTKKLERKYVIKHFLFQRKSTRIEPVKSIVSFVGEEGGFSESSEQFVYTCTVSLHSGLQTTLLL